MLGAWPLPNLLQGGPPENLGSKCPFGSFSGQAACHTVLQHAWPVPGWAAGRRRQLGAAAVPAIHGQAKHGSICSSGNSEVVLHAMLCCTVHGHYLY